MKPENKEAEERRPVGETPSSWSPVAASLDSRLVPNAAGPHNRQVHDAGGDTVTIDRWNMADAIRQVE
jgi:hypothetical protein